MWLVKLRGISNSRGAARKGSEEVLPAGKSPTVREHNSPFNTTAKSHPGYDRCARMPSQNTRYCSAQGGRKSTDVYGEEPNARFHARSDQREGARCYVKRYVRRGVESACQMSIIGRIGRCVSSRDLLQMSFQPSSSSR